MWSSFTGLMDIVYLIYFQTAELFHLIQFSCCKTLKTMAGGVFHVEFGFNDTPLTRSLESGNYILAEKLISETNNPSSLDEGLFVMNTLFQYKFVSEFLSVLYNFYQ